jgi:PST family polysaccharide transporter
LRLGSFGAGIVAARLIAPAEFGVFAVALTVHAVIVNASDVGVNAYVVRRRGGLDDVGPTVTTVAIVSALLMALAMVAAAPWLSAQLGAPHAVGAVRVMSLTIVLAGVGSVPAGIVTRDLRQDLQFLADAAYFFAANGLLIALALLGSGAMALAWSRVAGQLVSTLVLLVVASQRFLPGFDRKVLRSVLRFGLPLIGASFLGFLTGNVDYIVVGHLLGAKPLGFYYLAYNMGSWPYVILGPVTAAIAVAAFSRVRHDRLRLPARIGTAMTALVAIAFPANALIVALALPLTEAIYGPRWGPASAALALTAVYGAIRVPVDLMANVMIAEGRTRAMFACQLVYLVVLALLTLGCVEIIGIAGAGLAHVVGSMLVWVPISIMILSRSTGFGAKAFSAAVARPLLAALATGLTAHLVAAQFASVWVALPLGAASGLGVYGLLMARWARTVARSARSLWSNYDDSVESPDAGTARQDPRAPLGTASPEGARV